jgi:hypothetical protein
MAEYIENFRQSVESRLRDGSFEDDAVAAVLYFTAVSGYQSDARFCHGLACTPAEEVLYMREIGPLDHAAAPSPEWANPSRICSRALPQPLVQSRNCDLRCSHAARLDS